MQPIFYKRDVKWFLKTKWKLLILLVILLCIGTVVGILFLNNKETKNYDNVIYVFKELSSLAK